MRSTKVRIPAISTKNGSRIQAVILSSNSRSYQLYHKSFPFPNRTAQSENNKYQQEGELISTERNERIQSYADIAKQKVRKMQYY